MNIRSKIKNYLIHGWWLYRAKNLKEVCMKHYAWPSGRYKLQLAKCGCSWCPSCFHNYHECDYVKGINNIPEIV